MSSPDVREPAARIVPLGPANGEELLRVDSSAFAFDLEDIDHERVLDHFEWDRTFGAIRPAAGPHQHASAGDWGPDEELCGQYTVYSLGLTVPGGREVPMAGLSWVGVHPDHRRRGVLKTLMRHHLDTVRERGQEALSGLFAAEQSIYGRFGYGEAASGVALTLSAGAELRPADPSWPEVRTQMAAVLDRADAVSLIQDLTNEAAATWPGLVTRADDGLAYWLTDQPKWHLGKERLQLIVASTGGRATGFAVIRRAERWENGLADGTEEVLWLAGLDAPTLHALWSRVVGFDLVRKIETPTIGWDHPLLSWLVDSRAATPRRQDGLWLRVVDFPRAMAERGYDADADVVVELADEWCPWNAGRWRFTASGGEGRCEQVDAPADLVLDAREVGAAYLGGRSIAASAAAGLVREQRPGAVAELSRALRGVVEPAVCATF